MVAVEANADAVSSRIVPNIDVAYAVAHLTTAYGNLAAGDPLCVPLKDFIESLIFPVLKIERPA